MGVKAAVEKVGVDKVRREMDKAMRTAAAQPIKPIMLGFKHCWPAAAKFAGRLRCFPTVSRR